MHPLNENDLCFALRKCYMQLCRYYNSKLADLGITYPQLTFLLEIKDRPNDSLTKLSISVGLDRSTFTRNIKLLNKNGYVEGIKLEDKRLAAFKLTDEGEAIVKRAEKKLCTIQDTVHNTFVKNKAGKVGTIISLLGNVAKVIEGMK